MWFDARPRGIPPLVVATCHMTTAGRWKRPVDAPLEGCAMAQPSSSSSSDMYVRTVRLFPRGRIMLNVHRMLGGGVLGVQRSHETFIGSAQVRAPLVDRDGVLNIARPLRDTRGTTSMCCQQGQTTQMEPATLLVSSRVESYTCALQLQHKPLFSSMTIGAGDILAPRANADRQFLTRPWGAGGPTLGTLPMSCRRLSNQHCEWSPFAAADLLGGQHIPQRPFLAGGG
ncbi:hypothetical protein MRB53_039947 [Persea americana]|nr:hypothetical protein MRB53_039947 [Persea americana]